MPADPSLIDLWLSPNVPFEDVMPFLHPYEDVDYYPVSDVVGNVRNDSVKCVLKIDPNMASKPSISSSPTKAITSFFKSTKDDPGVDFDGQEVKKELKKEPKRERKIDPKVERRPKVESVDSDLVEVVEETTTEARRKKRKERVHEHKMKSPDTTVEVIDLDDDLVESKPAVKRPKRERVVTEVVEVE